MERERLKDLCANALSDICQITPILSKEERNKLGDFIGNYLAGNGVVVLPCKVGDTVYFLDGDKGIVTSFYHYADPQQGNAWISILNKQGCRNNTKRVQANYGDFGKTVFLTLEAAEAELKRRRANG